MSSNISELFDGIPTQVEFKFFFPDDVLSALDINNPVIQQYPNYLTLENDELFFNALNEKLSFFHIIHRIQPYIALIDSFVRDSQGRIFQIEINHIQGVNT